MTHMKIDQTSIKFAFFGSSRFSVIVIDELEKLGLIPTVIITTPDKPQGRKLITTPTQVKEWAVKKNIKVFDPEKLDAEFIKKIDAENCLVFIVASYGKIIPNDIINLPKHKTLNIHPSLLPKYRGASPIQSAIIDDSKKTGVTIMKIDEIMDHGPIVAQKEIMVNEWPIYEKLEELMAIEGARLLAEVLPKWITGQISEIEQDHSAATFTKKINKGDGLTDLNDNPYKNFRKIQAYHEWPQAYFLIDWNSKKLRIKITSASFTDGKLILEKVIPENGKEMSYENFKNGYKAG